MTTTSRRLHVAHITLGLDMGGQEKLLVEFARHADRGRFKLMFVSLGGRGVLADDIEALGWPVMTLNAHRPGLKPTLVTAPWPVCFAAGAPTWFTRTTIGRTSTLLPLPTTWPALRGSSIRGIMAWPNACRAGRTSPSICWRG